MSLAAAVLVALTALPRPWCASAQLCPDADTDARHLVTTSYSIASAAERATCSGPWAEADATVCVRVWPGSAPELAALLIAVGYHESRFDERVALGLCPLWGCSPGWRRARSMWAIEHSQAVSADTWAGLLGLDLVAVSESAWTAARILALSRGHCAARTADWCEGTVSGFASGQACRWSGARGVCAQSWVAGWRIERRLRADADSG